jgi:hypothetical protein
LPFHITQKVGIEKLKMRNFTLLTEDSTMNLENKDLDKIQKNNLELLDTFYDNQNNLKSKTDEEIANLVTTLDSLECNSLIHVLYHIKINYRKEKYKKFILDYPFNEKIIEYLNNIEVTVMKEYDPDAHINEVIFEDILYYHEKYSNIKNQEDFSNDESEEVQYKFEEKLDKLKIVYSNLIDPTLNKNFKGYSNKLKMDREILSCEFYNMLNEYEYSKEKLWLLTIGCPEDINNKSDFIFSVCNILKDQKDKTIIEIINTLEMNGYSNTLATHISDLLYNSFMIHDIEYNLNEISQPISF